MTLESTFSPYPQPPTKPQVYAERYHHLKAPRKLMWRPSLGAVTLEVSCGGAAIEFRVTPLHAALLLRFAGRAPGDALSAGALAAALGVPQAVVRRKALFWVDNGVLAEGRTAGGDVAYRRVEALDPSRIVSTEASDLSWDDAAAGGPAPGADDALAGMAPFENFILGILTNFSAVALDRLHNLLRVFVVGEPKYEGRSQEQLGAFLAHLVAQGKVEVDAAGVYRRKKG
ncbi:anaphase-promoting complex subunit 2 [Monoraphidium neglectum]|uniref:Anaphase-promoting complex subunit 2 n=1 Tax=Monoraphidium neglectum TaxID=145388 RepID=A0A0D2MCE5_9CHLO|nr:anaphase-promoting complex subunit 2 [Monoraphidium neglectum]KIY92945.1 anaphase-promoting complex subunit 2 [Monoraphidium neglectum]|eukprot:XP_013891965.1 anaphase-promoting complex subunit 2 [Monoraphidium neglectum]